MLSFMVAGSGIGMHTMVETGDKDQAGSTGAHLERHTQVHIELGVSHGDLGWHLRPMHTEARDSLALMAVARRGVGRCNWIAGVGEHEYI